LLAYKSSLALNKKIIAGWHSIAQAENHRCAGIKKIPLRARWLKKKSSLRLKIPLAGTDKKKRIIAALALRKSRCAPAGTDKKKSSDT
jgi:hypothetical protein